MRTIRELFLFNLRMLFFRTTREDFDAVTSAHLKFGLFSTWIVGMGRWWDDPNAKLVQQLGLGSIAYIIVLAAIVWLLVLPLKARAWSYRHVLTFISLTSLPALLYAIPVEQFLSVEKAITVNVLFLAAVAFWRVSLFFFYLGRHAALGAFRSIVVGLLPICAIVFSLTTLNLHRVAFNVMGGIREVEKSPHDGEYGVLFMLTLLSTMAIIPLVLCYLGMIVHARTAKTSPTLPTARIP